MGDFIKAEDVKTKTRVPILQTMDPDDIELLYIRPAERMIELHFRLSLNTDRQPRHWAGDFDADPDLEAQFRDDYKSAAMWTIEQMAFNPHGLKSQGVRGSQAVYDTDPIPIPARALMQRWQKPLRVGR